MQRYREKQTIQNFTAIFLLFLLLKFVFRESFCPLPFRYAPVTVGSGRQVWIRCNPGRCPGLGAFALSGRMV